MIASPADADWLAAAARLAERGRPLSRPNPAVGALLVREGRVLARGWTQPGGRPHAEATALSGADAAGATLYVTLEPCAHLSSRGPSCADLIVAARPARLVYAEPDPDPRTGGAGAARVAAAGIEVMRLPCDAARRSLAGYLTRARLGRPYVTLKLAVSLDGRIALPDGTSRWITGEPARAHVHAQRARQDAIVVGGGTWRADQPRLDVRLPGLEARSPHRIVLTRGGVADGVGTISAPEDIATLSDTQYMYVEGGAWAAAAFLRADLVDRLDLYRAPVLIGEGRAAIGDLGLAELGDAHGRWRLLEQRRLGSDLYEAYERQR